MKTTRQMQKVTAVHDGNESLPKASPTLHLQYIDGLRGLAIFWVFLFHCWFFNGKPLNEWWNPIATTAGVNLFLVLSGFCLYYSIAKNPDQPFPNWADYARRRFWRIYPPYFFVLTAFAICALIINAKGHQWIETPFTISETIKSYLYHLILLHTYSSYSLTLNHPLWTIGLEASFYVVFPLLVFSARRIGVWSNLSLVVLAAAISLFFTYPLLNIKHLTYSQEILGQFSFFLRRLIEFTFGMTAASLVGGKRNVTPWQILIAISAITFIAAQYASRKLMIWDGFCDVILGLSAFFLLLSAASLNPTVGRNLVTEALNLKFLANLGIISYSLYLIHQPILRYSIQIPMRKGFSGPLCFLFAVFVSFPLITGLAYLYHKYVESPFHKSKASMKVK